MKKILLNIIQFILIIIIAVCLFVIGKRLYDHHMNRSLNNKVQQAFTLDNKKDKEDKKDDDKDYFEKKKEKNLKELAKLMKENEDIIGYIEIPGTYISYPILHSSDNDFYLYKNFKKEYDLGGSIFADYINNSNFSDPNTVIYGHHMDTDIMFTALDNYRKEDFAKSNRTIYITTKNELREYKIFSVYAVPEDYDYRKTTFSDNEQKLSYFKHLSQRSDIDFSDINEFKNTDSIITLSTCQYDYEGQRLGISAIRIR